MDLELLRKYERYIKKRIIPLEIGRNSAIMQPFISQGIWREVERWLQEKHQVGVVKDYLFFPNRRAQRHLVTLLEFSYLLEQT